MRGPRRERRDVTGHEVVQPSPRVGAVHADLAVVREIGERAAGLDRLQFFPWCVERIHRAPPPLGEYRHDGRSRHTPRDERLPPARGGHPAHPGGAVEASPSRTGLGVLPRLGRRRRLRRGPALSRSCASPSASCSPPRRSPRASRPPWRRSARRSCSSAPVYPLAAARAVRLAERGTPYLAAAHGFEYWLSLMPGSHALMRYATSRASRVPVMCSAFIARTVRTAVPGRVPVSVLYPGADLTVFRPDLETADLRAASRDRRSPARRLREPARRPQGPGHADPEHRRRPATRARARR